MSPEDIVILRQFSDSLSQAYYAVKSVMPAAEFEAHMANLSEEIVGLQATSNKPGGISFMTAGLLLLMGDAADPDDPTNDQDYQLQVKAAIAWYCMNKEDIEGLLNTKL